MKRFSLFLLAGLLLSGLIFLPPAFSQSNTTETLTISTYYPSPYGVYNELRLYPKSAPPASACLAIYEGTMYYDQDKHELIVCNFITGSGYGWRPAAGLWTLSGTDLSPTNPAWNVGIGTSSPGTNKLYVLGTGRFTGALNLDTQGTSSGQAIHAGRSVTGVTGLTGGGPLTSDRTLSLDTSLISACGVTQKIYWGGSRLACGTDQVGGGGGNITIAAPGGSATGSSFTFAGNVTYSGGSTFTFSGVDGPPGGVSGSGSTNYIPKWTGSTVLGNSQVYDNGANVGIGTASPSQRLEVAGNVKVGRFTVVDTMYGGGPYYPAVGTDGTNTGVASGPGGNFFILNSAGSYGNTYGNDYWIQAANGGAGKWASSLGGGGGGPTSTYYVLPRKSTIGLGSHNACFVSYCAGNGRDVEWFWCDVWPNGKDFSGSSWTGKQDWSASAYSKDKSIWDGPHAGRQGAVICLDWS